jgi:hypothetical protein
VEWPPWTFSLAHGIEDDQSRTFIPNFGTEANPNQTRITTGF